MKNQKRAYSKKKINTSFYKTSSTLFVLFILVCANISAQNIVQQHGRLKVVGNKVVNQNNQPISLAGNSLYWSNYDAGSKYYNATTINHLVTNWNTDIVRASMGVDVWNGYIDNPTQEKNKVIAVVDAAINAGVYVIIDWHSHNAELYQQNAITFFTEMSQLYGGYDNVIYEVFNEPVNQSWSNTIKPYSEAVINAIRSNDPDNLIVVGTRLWSTEVIEASNNPINQSNIAYTLHFYAGTHGQWLRDNATDAMNNGIALFVTEWGSVNAQAQGPVDVAETELWMQYLQDNNISHANWSVSDIGNPETASVVSENAGVSGLINNNLSPAGFFVKDIIENWNSGGGSTSQTPFTTQNIPGTIQAEDYDNGGQGLAYNDNDGTNNGGSYRNDGVDVESTGDIGGGNNVGWTADGEWLEYTIASVTTGDYNIVFRVASDFGTAKGVNVTLGNTFLGYVDIPNTGGWQNWQEVSLLDIPIIGGANQILRFDVVGGAYNINWIDFQQISQQSAYLVHDIPGVIQAEDYDFGGQDIAYNDSDSTNSGGSYRNDGVDIENTTDIGGGNNVGWTVDGEWLEYTIASVVSGNYDISFRIASDFGTTKSISVSLDGNNLGNIDIPNTGGWQNWQEVTLFDIPITGGTNQILRLDINGGIYNINYMDFNLIPNEDTYVIRAKGDSGQEQISLTLDGVSIAIFNLSTSWQNYTVTSTELGMARIEFINDAGGRDLEVDYMQINNNLHQTEDQSINTAVWQNNSCGGSFSQFMHCGGYIEFTSDKSNNNLIHNRENSIELVVYPNPSNGVFNINLNTKQLQSGTVSVFDYHGKMVKTIELKNENQIIDIRNFPSGIYFVKVLYGNQIIHRKIVKQ